MSPETIARELEEFLLSSGGGSVFEQGAEIFRLDEARFAVTHEHGKCLLHLWSGERNIVRRVLDSELKNGILRLKVQRFGLAQPSEIEVCRTSDRRTPSQKKKARQRYPERLARLLTREFAGWELAKLATTMDLHRGFSPVYARGWLQRGRSRLAVLGVNAEEPRSAIDAALTFGLLWLDHCRERDAGRAVFEGLALCVPAGSSDVLRARIAHLHQGRARLQLCEIEEPGGLWQVMDGTDQGNIATRLTQCPDTATARERFAAAIDRIHAIVPGCELYFPSAAEVSFRWHGLEFARARHAPSGFQAGHAITFGAGRFETPLTAETAPLLQKLTARLVAARSPAAAHADPLWRLQPERWLQSLLADHVTAIDGTLAPAPVYEQVPAFSAADRAMIDLLAVGRDGRLAVIEVKADEDIHLALQGLDYWARVRYHHRAGEFARFGYFPGQDLAPAPPRLLLVAPALRVHPATEVLLRYLSPQVDCRLVAVNEDWRNGVQVVFRKSATSA